MSSDVLCGAVPQAQRGMIVQSHEEVAGQARTFFEGAERVRAAGLVCKVGAEWLAINLNLTMLHEGMEDPHHFEVEHEGIRAFNTLLRGHDLVELLANLDAGRLQMPSGASGAVVPGSASVGRPRFRERRFAQRDLGVDWPCNELVIQGGGWQSNDLPERFSRFVDALPTMQRPIDGRLALQRELDTYGDLAVDRGGHVYLRRPLPLRLAHVGNTKTVNEVEIVVEAYGAVAETFRVSVMPEGGQRVATRLVANQFEGTTASQFRALHVLPQPGPVRIVLTVRDGEVADDLRAGVPWAPVLIHQQFDPGCQLLGSMLFGPSGRGQKDSHEFESGVVWLLNLCGCAAMDLGRKDLQAAPDLVARTPSGELIVGECSLLGPTDLKVDKLRERAQAVAALLGRAGVPTHVRALLFIGEPCDASFDSVEMVDVRALKDIVSGLRTGRPDGLI